MKGFELTCLLCPTGCNVKIVVEGSNVKSVEGARCKKGVEYATTEFISPKRTVTTTVRIYGGMLPVIPVKTSRPIPKGKIRECMVELAKVAVTAPIRCGTVILHDILETGSDVMATRDMERG